MLNETLAACGLKSKPNVVKGQKWHLSRMRKPKKVRLPEDATSTQHLFVRRINDELASRQWSDNEFAARCKARGWDLGQSSISRITGGRQDPTLSMLHKLADSLGMQAADLLTDRYGQAHPKASAARPQNVRDLPPFPSMLGGKDKSVRKVKGDRKRR
jgi:transcriptional regulator with XRE-family HTH domain